MMWERRICGGAAARSVMPGELALRHVTGVEPDTLELVVCGLTRHQRAYVSDGLRRARVRYVATYEELDRLLHGLERCDAFVLAAEDSRGRGALGTVQRLQREWPRTAVVVFCPARAERPMWMPALTLAGVRGFVFEGVNDTAATLAGAVENARNECLADDVRLRLLPLLPATLHTMVHAVLARPDDLTSVESVASYLGVHRKTLVNRCARAGVVPPAELINWCRLALVAERLERTGATIESVALTLGFPSHTALRNLIKRYTGMTASEIRANGGADVVLTQLAKRLKAARAELPMA